jgi:hypothetical protein
LRLIKEKNKIMKKRKVKLFASIASLAMVVAVMGVGVWAATQQSVTVSSNVKFEATGITGTVALKVSGDAAGEAKIGETDIKATATNIATFALEDEQSKNTPVTVDIKLADVNKDGFFSAADGTITYTFTIDNTSTTVDMFYKATVSAEANGWAGVANPAAVTQVENGTPATLTVVFTYSGEAVSVLDTKAIPTITIAFASSDIWTQAG